MHKIGFPAQLSARCTAIWVCHRARALGWFAVLGHLRQPVALNRNTYIRVAFFPYTYPLLGSGVRQGTGGVALGRTLMGELARKLVRVVGRQLHSAGLFPRLKPFWVLATPLRSIPGRRSVNAQRSATASQDAPGRASCRSCERNDGHACDASNTRCPYAAYDAQWPNGCV